MKKNRNRITFENDMGYVIVDDFDAAHVEAGLPIWLDGPFPCGSPELIIKSAVKERNTGCDKPLARGQWWSFCGQTDMGQSLPVLCTECGGEFKLREEA